MYHVCSKGLVGRSGIRPFGPWGRCPLQGHESPDSFNHRLPKETPKETPVIEVWSSALLAYRLHPLVVDTA
eukprot:460925-Prorocentrum_minimum.AAC.3